MMYVISTFLLFYSGIVFSAGSDFFNVEKVGCFNDGKCFIGITPESDETACPNNSQVRFSIENLGANPQYSAALTAFSTGQRVKISINDQCIDGYPSFDWLYVTK